MNCNVDDTVQQVAGRWQLGLYVCLVWTGSDVVLSTTSIMHLCAIALYRYNGIASPLRVRSTHDMRNVAALVTPSWLIALALSIPFAVQGLTDSSNVLVSSPDTAGQFLQCGLFNRTFAAYSSLVSFFVPLTVMIFADIRSIQILRNNIRLGIPPSTSAANKSRRRRRGPNATTGECCVDDSSPPGCAPSCYAATSTADVSALQGSSSSTNCSTPRSGNVALELSLLKPFYVPQSRRRSRGTALDENQQEETVSLNSSSSRYLYRGRSKSKPVIYISMLTSGGCSMKVNSRERRAERTLVWVFVVFVVLWLPFFSVNLVYGLCHSCHIPGHVFAAFTWLGYLSSGVNPCIYTYLNKDFRNAFNRILTCKRVGQPQIRRQYS